MSLLRWIRNALVTLSVVGLVAISYLGDHYIRQRSTSPDAAHSVPFAAHGDFVFLTRAESRDYYLLWAATAFVGLLGGWASVVYDVRIGKIERPQQAAVWLVTTVFAFGILINLYWAFTT
jgi:hypothetical protein